MLNKFPNEEYPPSEDTFFLDDYIKNEKGKMALDIGSGSGYLTKTLSKNFDFVVGTDINFFVLKNQTYKTENLICCNGADALYCKFDLIICNLPYLSTNEVLDPATDGGLGGLEIPTKIIKSAKDCIKEKGKFLFITSSLSDYQALVEFTKILGFQVKKLSEKKLFFETLIIIEAKKSLS